MIQSVSTVPRLQVSEQIEERQRSGELTSQQVEEFRDFLAQIDRELLSHRTLTNNESTAAFWDGLEADRKSGVVN
jgi:hypothetical protein